MTTQRTLQCQLSDDCKTYVVYSIEVFQPNPDLSQRKWINPIPVFEAGTRGEAQAFMHHSRNIQG